MKDEKRLEEIEKELLLIEGRLVGQFREYGACEAERLKRRHHILMIERKALIKKRKDVVHDAILKRV